jgi:hypothetical protein
MLRETYAELQDTILSHLTDKCSVTIFSIIKHYIATELSGTYMTVNENFTVC